MEVKGQTKPVTGTLAATKTADGHDLRFTWDLKLTDFGIQTPSFMDVTLTEKVNLDVNVQGKFQ
jgi:polyisoprenoid-binding protein YceI